MAIVYLGIGSNTGQRQANFEEAIKQLRLAEGIKVITKSQFYTTEPVGGPQQEDYLNGVLKINTEIPPERVLTILKAIEKNMGRKATSIRNYPRVIDLDILLYDSVVMETNELTIPHPELSQRHFVLRGLCEIAPDLVHPVLGKTVEQLYACDNNNRRNTRILA